LRGLLLLVALVACGGHRADPPPLRDPPLSAAAYAHYLRGRLAAIDGDYLRAAAELRAAAAAAPGEAPIQVALASALYRAGRRQQARTAIEAAQVRFGESSEVWRESGRIYRGIGRPADAARAYRRAIALAPDAEASYLGLASAQLALGQPEPAESSYRALLGRRPLSVVGHYRLGRRLLARGRKQEAERHLRRALELEPSHTRARVALARLLRERGRPREAVALLREAFDRSSNIAIGERLFHELLEVGDREAAASLLQQIDRDDLELDVRITFGYLYLQIGERAAALDLARKLAERHPSSGPVRLLEGRALADIGRRDQAVAVLLAVPPERPAFAECRALAAELEARGGRDAAARAAVEEALASHPRDPGLIAAQALVAELGGRIDEARGVLTAAVQARPDSADLLYALAALEDRQGNPDRAVELAERILVRDPDHTGALNFIGFSLADRNVELARADKLLARALELAPADGYILDSVGWLRFRQRRFDKARTLLERAARLAPAEPEILWHLGELLLATRQPKRALLFYERARDLGPDEPVRRRIEARIHALRR
jgi:tetratricopeptide (TPR) repeat protein